MVSSFNKFKPQHNFFLVLTAGPFVHMQKNFQIWFGFSKEFLYVQKKYALALTLRSQKCFLKIFTSFYSKIRSQFR